MELEQWIARQKELLQLEQDEETERYPYIKGVTPPKDYKVATESLPIHALASLGLCLTKLRLEKFALFYSVFYVEFTTTTQENVTDFSSGSCTHVFRGNTYVCDAVVRNAEKGSVTVAIDRKYEEDIESLEDSWITLLKVSSPVTARRVVRALDAAAAPAVSYFPKQRTTRRVAERLSDRRADLIALITGRTDAEVFEPSFAPCLAEPFADTRLTESQRCAVDAALRANEFAAIWGPPGTGKTTTLAAFVTAFLQRTPRARVLLSAASNTATDNLLAAVAAELQAARAVPAQKRRVPDVSKMLRVGHPARASDAVSHSALLSSRIAAAEHAPVRDALKELRAVDAELKRARKQPRARRAQLLRTLYRTRRTALREIRQAHKDAVREIFASARVVAATAAGCGSSDLATICGTHGFDLVVVDEAGQVADQALLLPALCAGGKLVIAGDPAQLPPTVLAPRAAALADTFLQRVCTDGTAPRVSLLRTQFRMHADIAAWPSHEFYRAQLETPPDVACRTLGELIGDRAWLLGEDPAIVFVDTAGLALHEEAPPGASALVPAALLSRSKRNPGEADVVTRYAALLLARGIRADQIGVITPYAEQAVLIRSGVAPGIEVSTVDGFQGREKEAILLSLVRSNSTQEVGFLADFRRLNVSVTRARRHLFVVGDSETLSTARGSDERGTRVLARFVDFLFDTALTLRPEDVDA
eukprot:gnl/Chilomastix_cuspidata/3383.p1 GENE.gnl/Chilomastix_cuspidata/3383~~gnl/Chilomastix_cuspidata/3383.p1  ORF type:complete len:705 (+),score=291.91 gnl/Chilomastix_cuspidata/3383:324-2438(+)